MSAKSSEPSITVSLTAIYDEVRDGNRQTAHALHRIELLTHDFNNMKIMQESLRADIESLKKNRWPIPSVAVLISFLSIAYVLLKDSIRGQ